MKIIFVEFIVPLFLEFNHIKNQKKKKKNIKERKQYYRFNPQTSRIQAHLLTRKEKKEGTFIF